MGISAGFSSPDMVWVLPPSLFFSILTPSFPYFFFCVVGVLEFSVGFRVGCCDINVMERPWGKGFLGLEGSCPILWCCAVSVLSILELSGREGQWNMIACRLFCQGRENQK
jgi:hypothetical protein